jgi:heat shock protein HslJ
MKKTLVLLAMFVSMLAACSPGASAPIVGEWRLDSYGDPARLTPAAPDVATSIIFDEDGQMSGNVGCNGFGGEYVIDGDAIVFGQVMSTLMFCEGPAGDQETVILGVFRDAASVAVEGDTLTITSTDGNAVVVLKKK